MINLLNEVLIGGVKQKVYEERTRWGVSDRQSILCG